MCSQGWERKAALLQKLWKRTGSRRSKKLLSLLLCKLYPKPDSSCSLCPRMIAKVSQKTPEWCGPLSQVPLRNRMEPGQWLLAAFAFFLFHIPHPKALRTFVEACSDNWKKNLPVRSEGHVLVSCSKYCPLTTISAIKIMRLLKQSGFFLFGFWCFQASLCNHES